MGQALIKKPGLGRGELDMWYGNFQNDIDGLVFSCI